MVFLFSFLSVVPLPLLPCGLPLRWRAFGSVGAGGGRCRCACSRASLECRIPVDGNGEGIALRRSRCRNAARMCCDCRDGCTPSPWCPAGLVVSRSNRTRPWFPGKPFLLCHSATSETYLTCLVFAHTFCSMFELGSRGRAWRAPR